ncbi:Callose synthase 7 [Asimina triloba]
MPTKSLSRKMTRMPTMLDADDGDKITAVDSELVPSSLSSIIPILRVANDIEHINPRVAYLCKLSCIFSPCLNIVFDLVAN